MRLLWGRTLERVENFRDRAGRVDTFTAPQPRFEERASKRFLAGWKVTVEPDARRAGRTSLKLRIRIDPLRSERLK